MSNRRKRAYKKMSLLVLLIAATLVIFGIIGTLTKSLIAVESDAVSEITPEVTQEPIPELTDTPTPQPTPEPVRIIISAAGDCTLGADEYFDDTTSFDAKYDATGDPGYFFQRVRHVFEQDDLTIVNFEGTLTERGTRKDKTYAFKGRPEYTAILNAGSVEAVNLANNHSFDYGEVSYQDTKAYLSEAGITSFGYDQNAVVEVNGVKVGLIGIYELPYGTGCADLLRENIAAVKTEGAKLIITSFHWGDEKEYYPNSIQKELAHIAIDEGAHLVLGHHPHVLQGIEEYKGRNIVYSLGNFCFGGNKNPSDKDTMIFRQTLTVLDGAVQPDNKKEVIPCSLSSQSDHNNYQPTVLQGEEKERVMGRIQAYSDALYE